MAKPEFRIQLEELIAQGLDRPSGKLADPMFQVGTPYTQDELRRRVTRYEAAAEPLSKVADVVSGARCRAHPFPEKQERFGVAVHFLLCPILHVRG